MPIFLKSTHINNQPFHLETLEKEEQTKPKANRRKTLVKMIAKPIENSIP